MQVAIGDCFSAWERQRTPALGLHVPTRLEAVFLRSANSFTNVLAVDALPFSLSARVVHPNLTIACNTGNRSAAGLGKLSTAPSM